MTTNKQSTAPASNGIAQDEAHSPAASELPENPLSEREMEVARLLVTGATNGEIARLLVISPHTVKVHLRNVFDKLQVSSRTEASMLLVKRGWVVMPGVEVGSDLTLGNTGASTASVALVEVDAPAVIEPEPLPDLEAAPRPWQLGIVMAALALALASLLLPAWIPTPKSTLGLLSDSGQTVLGEPVLNNLPYQWKVHAPLSQPRSRLAAVEVAGKIYVAGGESEEGIPLDLLEIYDLASGQWREGAPMPTPRANFAMTISGDDLIVAGGSRIDTAANGTVDSTGDDEGNGAANPALMPQEVLLLDDMARYHRDDDRWITGGKLPLPLAGTALTAHGDMLYVLGGWDGNQMQSAVWRLPLAQFEEATREDWVVISQMPNAVAWFGAVMVDNLIYVAGGYDGRQELADFGTFDVSSGEWRALTSLNFPRGGMNLVHDGSTVLALGGGWASTIQSHERYDALTNQWTNIASPISGEWRHFGAAANEGSVYILGGWSGAYLDMHVQFQSTFRALLPVIPNRREEN